MDGYEGLDLFVDLHDYWGRNADGCVFLLVWVREYRQMARIERSY